MLGCQSCLPSFGKVMSCKSCRRSNEKLQRVWMSFTKELSRFNIPVMFLCWLLNSIVTCGSNSRHMYFQRHRADDPSKLEGELTVMPVCSSAFLCVCVCVCNDILTIFSQLSVIPLCILYLTLVLYFFFLIKNKMPRCLKKKKKDYTICRVEWNIKIQQCSACWWILGSVSGKLQLHA